MASKEKDEHYSIGNLFKFFESMNENQKPFQIAYGGGEPTLHPYFCEIMELTRMYGVSPNYTTNGMFVSNEKLTSEIIKATTIYCEGVAVSCHKQLENYWKIAVECYLKNNIFTNFHLMISDRESIDYFLNIYKEYKNRIKYFVLLPLIDQGRCEKVDNDFDYLFEKIKELEDISDIAFGAKFYESLKSQKMDVSLYEPEMMSKFIDLKDGAVYKSSFDVNEPIRYI